MFTVTVMVRSELVPQTFVAATLRLPEVAVAEKLMVMLFPVPVMVAPVPV